jgi:hypothetical protein
MQQLLVGEDGNVFERVLRRCFRLSNITLSVYATYANYLSRLSRTDAYLTANPYAQKDLRPAERDAWWSSSIEYTSLVNDLRQALWSVAKDVKDPKRPKKKQKVTQASTTPAEFKDKKSN